MPEKRVNPLADMSQSIDLVSESIYFMINVTATVALSTKVPKNVLERYTGPCLVNVDFKSKDMTLHYQQIHPEGSKHKKTKSFTTQQKH